MQHHTDPTYAIDQIDAFLSKIDYLQQLDCENPDGEREITKLEINIRGFLRTYFKEYKEKLQDLKNDRSDYITKHFFDPDNLVNDQRDYENDLEIIKNHLIAYKTELESINNSRRKAVLPTQPKRITKKTSTNPPVVKKQTSKEKSLDNRKVFIVHGHNETSKTAVESFLIALELEPIILHKQADLGKTIIEKVEHYSDVGFAIILLTKDDFGGELPSGSTNEYNLLSKYMETPDQIPRASEKDQHLLSSQLQKLITEIFSILKPRARQNVIFEFGYFIGLLGRGKVAALCEKDITRPSDIDGLLYTPLDEKGEWKKKLATEINAAGICIDEKFF